MNTNRLLPTAASNSSTVAAQTLYYYNVDAILSELIRPVTPKRGNLARPRIVKPEPIRPQQLIGIESGGSSSISSSSRSNKDITGPFALLNDRAEGARNPDPFRQQMISPFSMQVGEDDEDDNCDISMTYSNGVIIDTMDHYYNSNSSSKRSRDDEDILYYSKSRNNNSITTEEMDTTVAALVTPNPTQYYSSISSSQPTVTVANSHSLEGPQYIVYKNLIDGTNNSISHSDNHSANHNHFFHDSNNSSNHVWTTTAPSTTVSYTIVKPIAMRPMEVIQHLDHHYYTPPPPLNMASPSQDTNSCQTMTKNLLYADALDDGSMRVCG